MLRRTWSRTARVLLAPHAQFLYILAVVHIAFVAYYIDNTTFIYHLVNSEYTNYTDRNSIYMHFLQIDKNKVCTL